jgi:hypothetical protein
MLHKRNVNTSKVKFVEHLNESKAYKLYYPFHKTSLGDIIFNCKFNFRKETDKVIFKKQYVNLYESQS